MANNTTINSELFTKLLADAQFAAYETSVARQLVTQFTYPSGAGKVMQVPVWNSVSAGDLTEGTAPSAANTGTDSVDITLAEIGTYFDVTDMLRDSAERDVMADLGFNAGQAISEKIDTDVFALFNSFSAGVGSQDSAITVDELFEAVATLRAAKVVGPLAAVVSPRQALQLKKALATAGGANLTANETGNSILRQYYIGSLAGCAVYESSLVKRDLDSDADTELNAVGAVFAPTAIGYAQRGTINMQTQYQVAKRSTDVMMSMVKGEAILQNAHGVKLIGSDSD